MRRRNSDIIFANEQFSDMKKGINILCVLIVCVISLSVIYPIYKTGYYFGLGFKAGWENADKPQTQQPLLSTKYPLNVALSPDASKLLYSPDTMELSDSNNEIPVAWTEAIIMCPDSKIPNWIYLSSAMLLVISIAIFILLLIRGISFVVNINKGKVFERLNVRLLNKIGIYLLILSVIDIFSGISNEFLISTLGYQFQGYSMSASWNFPWSNMLLGLCSLLMAQIWTRGICMREEQDLTI